ncbi:MAG: hypothetical protein HY652_01375 [Acidobacteria bacterium]|nr:hypothetical protein [Acidobacteriota bacterium]
MRGIKVSPRLSISGALILFGLSVLAGTPAQSKASKAEVEEIIRKFAAKEKEAYEAWMKYAYHQRAVIEVLSHNGFPTQERMIIESDVVFDDQGRRSVKVRTQRGRLVSVGWTPEDMETIHNIQPFALTTEDLPRYEVKYLGKERVDEIDTHVFRVSPRKIQEGRMYFKGKIWVDDQDFQIVRTVGKAVPESRVGGRENKFPEFETLREQIDGKYWFPTWTEAHDVLVFGLGSEVEIRELITYTDYKKFDVGTKVTY